VPLAGIGVEAQAAKGRWLLLRQADGLAFRPADFERAVTELNAAGFNTTETRRGSWPGKQSDEAGAVGCVGGLLAFGLVCLGAWLVSLTGLDFDGPWGRPVILVIYAAVLALLGVSFGRTVQRWKRGIVARGPDPDDGPDEQR
jgi:hypothetical protein